MSREIAFSQLTQGDYQRQKNIPNSQPISIANENGSQYQNYSVQPPENTPKNSIRGGASNPQLRKRGSLLDDDKQSQSSAQSSRLQNGQLENNGSTRGPQQTNGNIDNDNLLSDNRKMKQLLDQLNGEYKKSQFTVNELQNSLQQAHEENLLLLGQINYVKGEIVKVRNSNDQLKNQLNILLIKEKELKTTRDMLAQFQQRDSEQNYAAQQFEELRQDHQILLQQKQGLDQDVKGYKAQIAKFQEDLWQLRNVEEKANGLVQDLMRMSQMLAQSKSEVEKVRQDNHEVQAEIRRVGEVDRQNQKLVRFLQEAESDNEKQKQQYLQLQHNAGNLDGRFQQSTQQNSSLKVEVNQWNKKCIALEQEVNRLQDVDSRLPHAYDQVNRIQQEMDIKTLNNHTSSTQLQQELTKVNQQLTTLQNYQRTAQAQFQQNQNHSNDQANEIQQWKKRCEQIDQQLKMYQESGMKNYISGQDLSRANSQVQDLEEQIEQWKQRCIQMEQGTREVDYLKSVNLNHERQLQKSDQGKKQMEESNKVLQNVLNELKQKTEYDLKAQQGEISFLRQQLNIPDLERQNSNKTLQQNSHSIFSPIPSAKNSVNLQRTEPDAQYRFQEKRTSFGLKQGQSSFVQ